MFYAQSTAQVVCLLKAYSYSPANSTGSPQGFNNTGSYIYIIIHQGETKCIATRSTIVIQCLRHISSFTVYDPRRFATNAVEGVAKAETGYVQVLTLTAGKKPCTQKEQKQTSSAFFLAIAWKTSTD